jgi:hypothetical protein
MKAKIGEDPNWGSHRQAVRLLESKHHQSHAHNTESKDPTVSIIMAEKRLMNMVQGDHQTTTLPSRFENQANVVVNHGRPTLPWSTLDTLFPRRSTTRTTPTLPTTRTCHHHRNGYRNAESHAFHHTAATKTGLTNSEGTPQQLH